MTPADGGQSRYVPSGFQMIRQIDIQNFRCFEHLHVKDCRRINVIVGDNGTGKTALLEAIFLPLTVVTQVAVRLRQQRGLEGNLTGSSRTIQDALFGDFFYGRDTRRSIQIKLDGTSEDNRTLQIARGGRQYSFDIGEQSETTTDTAGVPIVFTWTDAARNKYSATLEVRQSGITYGGTGEDLPNYSFYSSTTATNSIETADRFSQLSRRKRDKEFIETLTKEYPWIEDLSIEVLGGAPAIHASVRGLEEKIPLPNTSGAINRIVAITLAMAARPTSVILVDELENGIYYKHHVSTWRSLLNFARQYDSQLFTSTHSEEWLQALVEAADNNVDDIALWRLENGGAQPILRQFSGEQVALGIRAGEVR